MIRKDEIRAKEIVARSGRILLSEGLAARTWGNISCRLDNDKMAITPSGLGYEKMLPKDIVLLDINTGCWEGKRLPSSERGIHIAVYQLRSDIGFILHTHQTYASAIGLTGVDDLYPGEEEKRSIGGIEIADYGLPGTKKLSKNVSKVFSGGVHVVLLTHHGAVVAGKDQDEAFERARLLESICKYACKGQPENDIYYDKELAESLASSVRNTFGHGEYTASAPVLSCAAKIRSIPAQLEDMAQMIGFRLIVVQAEEQKILKTLRWRQAVLVPGVGAICRASTKKDCLAMCSLIEKACISWLHTQALDIRGRLSHINVLHMRSIYKKKYSRMIGD